ncbi:MAG TPA: tyrosine-type recombinase/integrase [Chthonomonadaceae bacterium]|nr:tyrosine-type recombinase/integrase [Chthonomonadaceae bacterium]
MSDPSSVLAAIPDKTAPDSGNESTWPIDVLTMLLEDKRSENTRRAYRHDVRAFFLSQYGTDADPVLVRCFLSQTAPQMAAQLLQYKARLIGDKLSEATINRRLSAVLSLIRFARRVGLTTADPGEHVDGEKVVAYRNTRGITPELARRLLRQPDRATLKGKRDYALLLLLLENALRRSEVVGLCIGDFDAEACVISIRGKGRGTQKERVTLSATAVEAIRLYLSACSRAHTAEEPLFINVSPAAFGRGLTADGLYKIVRELARQAGLPAQLSPHRLRHTAITIALDASGGDIRRVQRLSRHARLETLVIYDDNRADLQGEMTQILSRILATPSESG